MEECKSFREASHRGVKGCGEAVLFCISAFDFEQKVIRIIKVLSTSALAVNYTGW